MFGLQSKSESSQDLQFLVPESCLVILKNLTVSRGSFLVRKEMTATAGRFSKQETVDLPIRFGDQKCMTDFALFQALSSFEKN